MRALTRRRLVGAAVILAAVVLPLEPAWADSVQDKQHQADALANRIDQLQNTAEQLTEDYNQAVLDLQQAQSDVTTAKTRLTQQQSDLSSLRSQMSQFALKSYVYADQSTGVATLLDEATLSGQAAGRDGYAALAMGANFDLSDTLKAQLEDTNRLQAQLEAKEHKKQQLTDAVTKKQGQVDKATAAAQAALAERQGRPRAARGPGRGGQGQGGGGRPAGGDPEAAGRGRIGGLPLDAGGGWRSVGGGPGAGRRAPGLQRSAARGGGRRGRGGGDEPGGQPLRRLQGQPVRGLRLLGPHDVGVGAGRREPAAPEPGAVRVVPARAPRPAPAR